MPYSQEPIQVPKDEWVELTANDITQISFQVLDGEVEIRRGGTDAPAPASRGWIYPGGSGEQQASLSSISAASGDRVWAKGRRGPGSTVLVDHA
ncbi:hypothetical protein [Leisingera thetidis]|uniref:hypothetical protein n=1 Tax=Leisingera thetidis TaxID=2930199 RepID=UPI0021F79F39|nr:hypothetical protein [Leisingera thetidis]